MRRGLSIPASVAAACLFEALSPACVRVDVPRSPAQDLYALDAEPSPARVAGRPAILVADTRAAPGLEGRGIVYVERAHEVRRYAKSAWVEPPARMLPPLLARALEQGGFRVVRDGESGGHLRLETEIVQLRQEFLSRPSRVRFALRLRLLGAGGSLLAEREIEAEEQAPSDDAYGGVVAANRAVSSVLEEVVAVCAEASARPTGAAAPDPPAGR
jgi:cholesterol transport system auxiliary component